VPHLRFILKALRIAVAIALAALVIKIAPTLASHAAGHANTYGPATPAASARVH